MGSTRPAADHVLPLKDLLAAGATPTAQVNRSGLTIHLLSAAALSSQSDRLVRMLLDAKADPHATSHRIGGPSDNPMGALT